MTKKIKVNPREQLLITDAYYQCLRSCKKTLGVVLGWGLKKIAKQDAFNNI